MIGIYVKTFRGSSTEIYSGLQNKVIQSIQKTPKPLLLTINLRRDAQECPSCTEELVAETEVPL